ncbi:hypothetical protein OH77DRAFT_1440545 [Trametes cingulata]|nr:hypothetical protein OH77DRAFT_1440545 [Trametes cingulata]
MIPESEFVGSLAPEASNYTTCIIYRLKAPFRDYNLRLFGKICGDQNWAQKSRNTEKMAELWEIFLKSPGRSVREASAQGTSNFRLLGAYFAVTMSPGLGTKSSILGLHEIQIKQNGVHLGAAKELYQTGWFIMCFSVT